MPLIDRITQRVGLDERLRFLPVVVVGAAEQDSETQVDLHQVRGDQFTIDDDSGRDEHGPAPLRHSLIRVVARLGVVEGPKTTQQHAPAADLLIAWQGVVEEFEKVVVQGDDFFHEFDIFQQSHLIITEELDAGHRPDPARVKGRGVDMPALHQAEHLPGQPAHLKRLAVEGAPEGVERPHDVGDRPVAVQGGVRGLGPLGSIQHAGIRFLDHLFAEIDADQVILEEVVIEHILGGLAEVDDPLGQGRRPDAESHVLRVTGAGCVVIAANPADPAGDEVGVARVLALHEYAVTAEDRRSAVALGDSPVGKVDLGVDAEAADDPGDRVPRHLDQMRRLGRH